MARSDSSPNSAINIVFSRRSHRKSRNGCKICKRRHLKCDETKPECLNCLNHSVQCVYDSPTNNSQKAAAHTQKKTRAKPSEKSNTKLQFVEFEYPNVISAPHAIPASVPREKPAESSSTNSGFCLEDFELQHFFLSSTCLSLMEDEDSLHFWRSLVPRVGFRAPLVHHLMLSLACLHMLRSEEHRQNRCALRFDYHYELGLQLMWNGLPEITAENAEAIWIGSILICFISMARGPREGDFLFFGSEGPVEWLALLQGVELISTMLHKGRSADEQEHSERHSFLRTPREYCAFQESMSRIRCFTEERAASDPLLHTYRIAIENVLQAFNSTFYDGAHNRHEGPAAKPEPFCFILFMLVTQLEKRFWDALQEKKAVPLVILAHFIVLMYRMHNTWFLHGWPEHILRGIWTFLEEEDRALIQWPIKEIQITDM